MNVLALYNFASSASTSPYMYKYCKLPVCAKKKIKD